MLREISDSSNPAAKLWRSFRLEFLLLGRGFSPPRHGTKHTKSPPQKKLFHSATWRYSVARTILRRSFPGLRRINLLSTCNWFMSRPTSICRSLNQLFVELMKAPPTFRQVAGCDSAITLETIRLRRRKLWTSLNSTNTSALPGVLSLFERPPVAFIHAASPPRTPPPGSTYRERTSHTGSPPASSP